MKRSISLLASLMVPVFMLAVANPAIAQDKAKDAKAAPMAKDAKAAPMAKDAKAAPMAKDAKAAPAAKAEKGKAVLKVVHEDDKVRVVEATFKPGDEAPNVARPFRVIRALKGGTLQRTWAEGKIDKLEFKTGEVKALEASTPYTPKNVGKSDLVLYVVFVKEPKK